MVSKILCATQDGLDSKVVQVEATFTRGLPSFNITGLASSSIKESQYRVSSALANLGFGFPPLKLNINLSPSDLPKNGSHFDLPIALLIVANKECLELDSWFAFGEVGLNGDIKSVNLIYPMLLDIALYHPDSNVILPSESRELFTKIPNLKMAFARNILDAVEILRGKVKPQDESKDFNFKHIIIDSKKYYFSEDFESDFSEVRNQDNAIRAALISACGFHNIIFEGSPGSGKSMIAKRLQHILPPLSLTEMIESVKLQAFNEQTLEYKPKRNFRSPHQSASKASILGSASQFKINPGEIALAHNGMIFFDELPYFKRDILESLREPLENNQLAISRVSSKIIYDTSFLFVAAMNPCPCGNMLSIYKECRCKDSEIRSYKNHLSEPLLDRIDLYIQMQEYIAKDSGDVFSNVSEGTFYSSENLDSKTMQKIVFKAFEKQVRRGQFDPKNRIVFNGKLNEVQVEQFCELDDECKDILQRAKTRFALSYRGEQKVRKVARTIADMSDSQNIQKQHILEAISYRKVPPHTLC